MMQGWEVSPDKIKKFNTLMEQFPIGNPIITSKCNLDKAKGFLVVGDNGFAWRIKEGFFTNEWNYGKRKWVRWHDVYEIRRIKKGQILIVIILRKDGALNLDKQGNYKMKNWRLTLKKNKNELNDHFELRKENFNNIILEIYNRNKVGTIPSISDSII